MILKSVRLINKTIFILLNFVESLKPKIYDLQHSTLLLYHYSIELDTHTYIPIHYIPYDDLLL